MGQELLRVGKDVFWVYLPTFGSDIRFPRTPIVRNLTINGNTYSVICAS